MAITKKDIDFIKHELKDAFATKQELHNEMRDMRDFVRQENNRMKTEIIREIVDVVTVVMDRTENHEARLVALEA